MRVRRLLLVFGALLLVVTAGCLGADDGGDSQPEVSVNDDAMDADAATDDAVEETTFTASAEADADVVDRIAEDRQLIRTGELRLEVDTYSNSADAIRQIATDRGGFVSDESREVRERDGEHWTSGTIVIRVPSEQFDDAMQAVESVGEVHASETRSEDVTDQLVDLEARLENLKVQRDQLRELYADANETSDVLAVQRELSSVQEEIERLEAQQQSLQEAVSLSTITVHLSEDRPEIADDPGWYETEVTTAFVESIGGVATALRAIVVGSAYLGPYLFVFGTPVAIAMGGIYWHRSRDGENPDEPDTP